MLQVVIDFFRVVSHSLRPHFCRGVTRRLIFKRFSFRQIRDRIAIDFYRVVSHVLRPHFSRGVTKRPVFKQIAFRLIRNKIAFRPICLLLQQDATAHLGVGR